MQSSIFDWATGYLAIYWETSVLFPESQIFNINFGFIHSHRQCCFCSDSHIHPCINPYTHTWLLFLTWTNTLNSVLLIFSFFKGGSFTWAVYITHIIWICGNTKMPFQFHWFSLILFHFHNFLIFFLTWSCKRLWDYLHFKEMAG